MTTLQTFQEFCSKLHLLNLIAISEEIFTEILFHQIEIKIQTTCKNNFQENCLGSILTWMDEVVYKWLQLIVVPPQGT